MNGQSLGNRCFVNGFHGGCLIRGGNCLLFASTWETPVVGGDRVAYHPYYYYVVLCSYCVLCDQCCQCLWIVHSILPLRVSLTFGCS